VDGLGSGSVDLGRGPRADLLGFQMFQMFQKLHHVPSTCKASLDCRCHGPATGKRKMCAFLASALEWLRLWQTRKSRPERVPTILGRSTPVVLEERNSTGPKIPSQAKCSRRIGREQSRLFSKLCFRCGSLISLPPRHHAGSREFPQ
jgi:hypothetical protein